MNEIENKNNKEANAGEEQLVLEKVNKINKSLAKLTKEKRKKTQTTSLRNITGATTTDSAYIKWIIRESYKQLYTFKFVNLDEIYKLLEKHNYHLPNIK